MNSFTWNQIGDCNLPHKLNPQLKRNVDLSHHEYVPLDGLSARSECKIGNSVTMTNYIKELQNSESRPCAVVGCPGSGKTIFMKRLAKKIIASNRRRDHEFWGKVRRMFRRGINMYDVTVYLNIKDFENLENVTLAQTVFNPDVTGLTAEEAQHGLHAILQKKIQAMMVFDGLDQTSWLPDAGKEVGPWTKTATALIFGNILTGHLLSEVPIAISSRQHSVAHLSQDMQPAFVTSLCGFNEADAKSMYSQVIGGSAEQDWDKLRNSNPGLLHMCLTPVFLLYYVITRRRDPAKPPDCTSGVMVGIVQILLESSDTLTSDDAVQLIIKLKQMAFKATRNRQTIFSKDDLKQFEISYCDVMNMNITESNMISQKILQGTPQKIHFCHQSLQDILTALHVAGMAFEDFVQVVDGEFDDANWSVVRMLTCGVLNNCRVLSKISERILRRGKCNSICWHPAKW